MEDRFQSLLVPVNGTTSDHRVVELVGQLAPKQTGRIVLLYVVEVAQAMPLDAELPADIEQGEQVLSNAEAFARSRFGYRDDDITTELLQARSAGAAIVDEAIERNVDAIVIAATNRLKYGKVTLSDSVAYVLKNAPCEVIMVRQRLT